ncbi:venom phosphodiesterase-like isoform X2 [Cherax quadricarinatus]|uniref:venom phosphodiesterase-like isoform X2 n=1 Tax=Cherax quadricarinatus TaxID=27406 RepID=UPI00387E24BF
MNSEVLLMMVTVSMGVSMGYPHPASPSLPDDLDAAPPTLPDDLDPSSCPPTYQQHPLVLISLDGFRAEYLRRGITPTIQHLADKGTRTPYMKPCYPTSTFPNHYTIVTGKRAATFFWPGSEVDGNQPTHWYYYNESIPFQQRIDKVLMWLDLPPETRPDFITLYMHEPDETAHDYGPHSTQVEETLAELDSLMSRLVKGLQARHLLSCVNLLVVSDHGMTVAGQRNTINLTTYIPDLTNKTRFWKGVFSRFTPHNNTPDTRRRMMAALAGRHSDLRVYQRQLLPIRLHMGSQRRVEEVVLDLELGFTVAADDSFQADAGDHGYDNYYSDMNAVFVAHGPEFRRNTEVEVFHNIELYNLMCHLLGITPAPNNGSWGALHHLLSNPPPPLLLPSYQTPEVAKLPTRGVLEQRLSEAECEAELADTHTLVKLLEQAYNRSASIMSKHLPWGVPHTHQSNFLLVQQDHVTAYSPLVKLPLWTSFTVSSMNQVTRAAPWMSDVRLAPEQSATCSSYHTVTSYNVTAQPLFPPEFSSRRENQNLSYLITNAVPFTSQLTQRWQQLINFIGIWMQMYGTLNIISGPVFDYDADTLADNMLNLSQSRGLVVPTHMFMVVSRCLVETDHLSGCPHTQVDALAFVYPQYLPITNCLDASKYAREFSATVQDVEKISGLKLNLDMGYEDRLRLHLRIHSHIWGYENWWNRLRTNVFNLGK